MCNYLYYSISKQIDENCLSLSFYPYPFFFIVVVVFFVVVVKWGECAAHILNQSKGINTFFIGYWFIFHLFCCIYTYTYALGYTNKSVHCEFSRSAVLKITLFVVTVNHRQYLIIKELSVGFHHVQFKVVYIKLLHKELHQQNCIN